MAVRNWWIEVDIDGRKTELHGGPVSKDGGFSLRIFQRDKGSSRSVLAIRGFVQGSELVMQTSFSYPGNTPMPIGRVETELRTYRDE